MSEGVGAVGKRRGGARRGGEGGKGGRKIGGVGEKEE